MTKSPKTAQEIGRRLGGQRGRGVAVYYSNLNIKGPLKYRDVPGSIGVLESPDNRTQIGQAMCIGWNLDKLAVWKLTIGGQKIAGRWMLVDNRFVPAH